MNKIKFSQIKISLDKTLVLCYNPDRDKTKKADLSLLMEFDKMINQVLPFEEAIKKATALSSPEDCLFQTDNWKALLSKYSGVPVEEIDSLIESGAIDKFLSEGFYALSIEAVKASLDAIASGEMPVEKLPDIAYKAAEMARKLTGKDIKKSITLTAELWQKEAEKVVVEME